MSFGRTEFSSRYGERPLEDLWRISNKQTIAFGFEDGTEGMAEGDSLGENDVMDRSNYLRNIPTTPEMMAASNGRIAQAYFNLGVIFKDRFKDNQSAVSNFESLVNRFPENENRLQAFYYLYNRELGDPARAETFKSRLINEFPESDFAQILGDPNYLQNFRKREGFATQLYEQTYRAFTSGNYAEVISNWDTADTLEIVKALRAQFSYLKALSLGKRGQSSEFRQGLEYVVRNFEGTPVHQPATDLLASLGTHSLLLPEEDAQSEEGLAEEELVSIYSYNPSAVHFFAFVFDVRLVEARELRNFITEFNTQNYPDSRLTMSNIFLDDRRQIITVTNFSDRSLGMEYLRNIVSSPGLSNFRQEAIISFIISVDNYPILYQDKDVEEYLKFFKARYGR